jgi:hypothetical protein
VCTSPDSATRAGKVRSCMRMPLPHPPSSIPLARVYVPQPEVVCMPCPTCLTTQPSIPREGTKAISPPAALRTHTHMSTTNTVANSHSHRRSKAPTSTPTPLQLSLQLYRRVRTAARRRVCEPSGACVHSTQTRARPVPFASLSITVFSRHSDSQEACGVASKPGNSLLTACQRSGCARGT